MRTSTNKIKANKVELYNTDRITLIDYSKAKKQILNELAYSSEFKNKIRKVVKDYGYDNLKNNLEDIMQEIFIELGKKDAEYIFNQYVKNPNSMIALGITICKSFFRINPKYPDYPNKSIVHKINYQSTASGKADFISPVDISFDEDMDNPDAGIVLADNEDMRYANEDFTVKEKSVSLVDELRAELNDSENKALDTMLKYFNSYKTDDDTRVAYIKLMETHKDFLIKLKDILSKKGITDVSQLF